MLNIILLVVVTLLTALTSLSGGLLLLSGSRLATFFAKYGTIFAALILTYTAFFDLIPEALESDTLTLWQVLLLVLAGIIICALLGFFASHFHRHGHSEPRPFLISFPHHVHSPHSHHLHALEPSRQPHSPDSLPRSSSAHHFHLRQAYTMLIIDCLHTVADGIVIGVSFASGLGTGLLTATATAAHEIPQEIGDFSLMLRAKVPRAKIAKLQILSALILLPAALAAYFIGDALLSSLPIVLSLVAGFFLYIVIGEIWSIIKSVRTKSHSRSSAIK